MERRWKPSKRQREAFDILEDKQTTELFYGGGAGGGKSYLGCAWLIICCLRYPGTRYLMGRAKLKSLKESTFLTFLGILRDWGLKRDIDWKYNAIDGVVTFIKTDSQIYLKDLFPYPSDPEFDSLGSTEYTASFIDEVSEITWKAKNIVMSRIRYKLDEYGLIPKLLMASNPAKNFAYDDYWRPWKDGKLEKYRRFVPALVGDNPFMSKHYEENLLKLDKNSKERLLYGNWDYDDDPSRLFEYDEILNIFTCDEWFPGTRDNQTYISADIARFGSDKSVVIVWKGLRILKIYDAEKQDTKKTRDAILAIAKIFQVPPRNIVVDDDGVGGGVVDQIKGCRGFVNNSRAFEVMTLTKTSLIKHNFANLKTQCWFKLSEYVHDGRISSEPLSQEVKTLIIQDLEQQKVKDVDMDNKLIMLPKEEIKEKLKGRSTDYGDALMMRMLLEVQPRSKAMIR